MVKPIPSCTLQKNHEPCKNMIIIHVKSWVNSLWPRDTIWWQGYGSTLVQEMAWCLTAPSHYLVQYNWMNLEMPSGKWRPHWLEVGTWASDYTAPLYMDAIIYPWSSAISEVPFEWNWYVQAADLPSGSGSSLFRYLLHIKPPCRWLKVNCL